MGQSKVCAEGPHSPFLVDASLSCSQDKEIRETIVGHHGRCRERQYHETRCQQQAYNVVTSCVTSECGGKQSSLNSGFVRQTPVFFAISIECDL
jgi:hypothetical protein